MTTQQITKAGKSVSQSQVTELQTSANNISAIIDTLTLDPWQNLNAAITGIESQIDNNDASNADDSAMAPNDETDTATEINNLVTDNNETPLLDTVSDPIIEPVDSSDDNTANTISSDEVIDNTTDTTIEPTVKPNESNAIDNTSNEIQINEPLLDAVINDETSDTPNSFEDQVTNADDGTSITDNSSEVIDNPEVVADIDNEIQIDEPLTDVVDVSDDSIMEGLVITDEALEIDNGNLDGLIKNNTDVLTDNTVDYVVWLSYTIRGTDTVVVIGTCPATSELDVNLNSIDSRDSATTDGTQLTLFSDDNMTAPNDDAFSNSDIPMLGTLTSNEDSDVTLTDMVDVIDDSIVGDLVMTNEPFGMDSGNLDGSIKNNTDLLTDSTTDSLTDTSKIDIGVEKIKIFSPEEVQVALERNINLNFVEPGDSVFTDKTHPTLFSDDNMTAPNDDVFSNSDIPVLETLTSNDDSDAPLTDTVDVTDKPIVEDLVTPDSLDITNEPLGMNIGDFNELIKHNIDLLASRIVDNLTEDAFTLTDIDSARFIKFSSNQIQTAFERNYNLNFSEPEDRIFADKMQITQFADDTITAQNNIVYSNSDMSMLGTLTFIEDHDDPLTDTVDVTDDSIVESLDITDEALEIDNSDLDELIQNNTNSFPDRIADSLTEVTSTIADTDTVDLAEFSSNEVEATSGDDVDLNSNLIVSGDSVATDETQPTLSSDDNMTAPNDDVFSNSDISILGTLTSNEDSDVPLPDSADVTDKPIVEDLVTPDSLAITNEPLGISELENNSYKWSQPTFTFADIDFMRLITFSDMEIQAAVERNIDLNLVEPGDPIFTDRTQPTGFYTDFPVATLTSTQFFNTDTLSVRTLTFIEDHDDLLTDTVDVTDDSIVENLDITNEPLGMDNVELAEFSSNEVDATSGGDVDLNSNFIVSGDSVATDETQPTLSSGDNMTAPNDDVFSASNPDIPAFETLSYSADNSPFIQLIGNSENIDGEG